MHHKDLVFTLLCLAFLSFNTQAVVFEVNPPSYLVGLTSNLTMSCKMADLAKAASSVLALQIEKEENGHLTPMAEIHTGSKAVIQATGLANRMSVSGNLDLSSIQNTNLQLTLTQPEETDEGHYLCVISMVDRTGLIQTLKIDANVDAVTANSTVILQAFIQMQKDLTHLVQQNNELVNNVTSLMSLNQKLETKMSACENNVSSLEARLLKVENKTSAHDTRLANLTSNLAACCQTKSQTTQPSPSSGQVSAGVNSSQCPSMCTDLIDQLTDEVVNMTSDVNFNQGQLARMKNMLDYSLAIHHRIAFSVRYNELVSGDEQVPLNTPITFDKLYINAGNAYDMATGTFTAPEDGTYMFQVGFPVRGSDPDALYRAVLTLDHFDALAQIESGGPVGNRSTPTPISELYVLRAGQKINIQVYQITGPASSVPTVSRFAAFFLGFWLH